MRTAMSASRRSRLVSSFEATSSISISGCSRCRRASTSGSSQVAATWLVVTRTTPRVAERALARPRADRERGVFHAPGSVDDGERGAGRHDAAAGALEQRRAELRLELGDMPAERRLPGAAALGRRADAAGVEDGEEAAHEGPVEVGDGGFCHAKVYVFDAETRYVRADPGRPHFRHRQPASTGDYP